VSALHTDPHPLAGQTVKLTTGEEFRVEDWADRVWGRPWGVMEGNPTALIYAVRAGTAGISSDDEVLYGKVDGLAYLAHASEVVEP